MNEKVKLTLNKCILKVTLGVVNDRSTRMCLDTAGPQSTPSCQQQARQDEENDQLSSCLEPQTTGWSQTMVCPHVDNDEKIVTKPEAEEFKESGDVDNDEKRVIRHEAEESKDEKIPTTLNSHVDKNEQKVETPCQDEVKGEVDYEIPDLPNVPDEGPDDQDEELFERLKELKKFSRTLGKQKQTPRIFLKVRGFLTKKMPH